MKIITNNKMYIQKKDLELIFKLLNDKDIPFSILKKYRGNNNIKDRDFILFDSVEDMFFLHNFWFIIDYNDIRDFNGSEFGDYYYKDLQDLREMRVEYDKHKFIFEKKIYIHPLEMIFDQAKYDCYLPNRDEAKNYPLDFRLLYNKVFDILEIRDFKNGQFHLNLPEDVYKPIRYSKKQLRQIYYEVLGGDLTFEELKKYEKELYCIFTKINYTPEIIEIIRKIIMISKYNTLDFINDDLLNIILRIEGEKSKFEETSGFLIDYLYTIGYNRFENFDSKLALENDLKLIKRIIMYIGYANLEDIYIDKLSQYNYILADIIRVINKCNNSKNNNLFIKDMFLNMLVYVYFKPNVIDYNYDFLLNVYDYLLNNSSEIIKFIGYNTDMACHHNEHFIDNFIKSNNLLIYLYNKEFSNSYIEENYKLIKSKNCN